MHWSLPNISSYSQTVISPVRLALFSASCFFAIQDINAKTDSRDPDKDPALPKLLEEARKLIDSKQPQAAIENCEKVIALFKSHYGNSKQKIYCARSSAESLGYLMQAAAAMSEGKFERGKKNSIVLSGTWASAYFLKSYALQDLDRVADAKTAIKLALELSPWSCLYLSELGSIYKLEKDWVRAREVFEKAEDNAALSPDNLKAAELGVARRGLGYVLVEQGKLDEAEKKYRQCLAENPNDTKAAAELEYVRGLKAKR
jgi:tetratricopeptide (TPR) repeat protein